MIIKKGMIVTENEVRKGDIRLKGELIHQIAPDIQPEEGETVIDADGCYVVPGGIDAHTHFDMPCGDIATCDDFYSGTKAAVVGGTTSVIDFSEPEQGAPLMQGLTAWHKKADGKAFCDYGFHMTVSRYDERLEAEIEEMIRQGVTSFKAYTAYKGDLGVEDKDLYRILALIKKQGGLLLVHCENGEILEVRQETFGSLDPENIAFHPLSRPNPVEHEAVSRVIDMARLLECPVYIVHTSTKEALKEIQEAREEGVKVYCETCPQYLLLTDDRYSLPGFEGAKYVCSPPLRKAEDQNALWKGVKEGIVDTISTDHCAFQFETQKKLGLKDFRKIPNGLPGAEHRIELMYTYGIRNGIPYTELARLTAGEPARIFGLYPKKGVIAEGSHGDLVILEKKSHIIRAAEQVQEIDYTPYEGMEVDYKVQHVFLRGHQVVRDGSVLEAGPTGQFLARKTR